VSSSPQYLSIRYTGHLAETGGVHSVHGRDDSATSHNTCAGEHVCFDGRSNHPAVEARVHKCFGKRATIVGTPLRDGFDDVGQPTKGALMGTRHADVIVGLGGNDRILGKGGDDLICGGRGWDLPRGGRGDDRISSGPGGTSLVFDEESMRGGRGDDRLQGDPMEANDIYGADVIRSRGVFEEGFCGDENCGETLFGGSGADRILEGRPRRPMSC
jgi:hypothetical protein